MMRELALFTPIRRRLVAWTMLILGLILVLLGTSVYATMSRSLIDQVDRNLVARSGQAGGALFGPPNGGGRQSGHEGYSGGVFYLAIGTDGQIAANPQQVQVSGVQWPAAQSSGGSLATVTVDGEPTRVFVGRAPNGGTLVIGQSLQPEESAMQTLLLVLIGGGGIGLLLSLGGAWFLSGRALVPIQRAFRKQQEFVADASHELRTPLTVLRSATDLLNQHRDEPLENNGELFDDVRSEILRMERLAQDLLTLARSDRGELQLMTAPVDLASLASDVVRRVTPLAESRSQVLAFERQDGPTTVEVDPERIQQVVLVLVDNALKYTPDGGRIDVRVRSAGGSAVIDVADTGAGIAPEHLPRLFDRFYRADAARSRAAGGAGLGLTIAKMLVDAHAGELHLTSTLGAGTVASVRLPLAVEPAAVTYRVSELATPVARR